MRGMSRRAGSVETVYSPWFASYVTTLSAPRADCLLVLLEVTARLSERVAAEFLEHCAGEHDGHHRLADHTSGGHGADIRSLVVRPDLPGAQPGDPRPWVRHGRNGVP